jgi:Flp pilus assembly protein TadD
MPIHSSNQVHAGVSRRGMRRFEPLAVLCVALSLVGLPGCEDATTLQLDPLSVSGRTGNAPPITYEGVMRVAAAARNGGDYGNAVGLFKHAAEMQPSNPDPLTALGDTWLGMGNVNEAINAYNAALKIKAHDPGALRGLAKAYLKSGRPDLAGNPLAVAYLDTPNDPKLLLLIGVADDFIGQHVEAQARYQEALKLAPGDRALALNLALSLALSEKFGEAIALLRPIATGPGGTPRERQTLALIYGLNGDPRAARQLAQVDLDAASVDHNLAFYESLRRLPADARSRAILSASAVQRVLPQS